MTDLNFSQIRNHDGSQDGGFEELVCQLAHLSPPEGADYFVRKEGAGGDAGVECYWKLKDGTEHAWQAKYFVGRIEANQWTQITKSVEAAIKKHPKLSKFYVCLPRDWTDSRKNGPNGKVVKSAWDHWLVHVAKWEASASREGMKVEFVYWCKHEISQMLQVDDPLYSGRALYWFNEPVLTSGHFERIAEKSRVSLGERYTPEFHLDLPIAELFEGVGGTEAWWDSIQVVVSDWRKALSDMGGSFFKHKSVYISEPVFQQLQLSTETLKKALTHGLRHRTFISQITEYKVMLTEIRPQIIECIDRLDELYEQDEEGGYEEKPVLFPFSISTNALINFLDSNTLSAATKRAILLVGEAGIGKSHLLCDITLRRLADGLPTLLLLGQHYSGGNPLNSMLEALDLVGNNYKQVLGALDATGEAHGSKLLIFIDAINEGIHRDEWYSQISGFISELNYYSNIAVIFSCRTTYINYMIPHDLIGDALVKVVHHGFRGFEHRAANKYLSLQGIAKPSAPITAPEFTNPLFLKTCCKALKDNGETSFPKGLQGISRLFEFYVSSIERVISIKKRYRPGENVIQQVLESFASKLYPNNLSGLPLSDARDLIRAVDPKPDFGDELFDELLHEGVLSEDIAPGNSHESRGEPVIRFTYERFSDHFVARNMISENVTGNDIESVFGSGGALAALFNGNDYYRMSGILSALSIYIAEKYNKEIVELIPDVVNRDNWLFDELFTNTLLWRSGNSFTKNTLECLSRVIGYGHHKPTLDIFLALATEPSHPWNADMLSRNLIAMNMPDRDAFWSTHIAISDTFEDGEESESVLRALIEWAHSGDLSNVESEQIRLCSTVLMWVTSSTNRKVRDQATKALVKMLSIHFELLLDLLEQFKDVDDLYIRERLYAIAYGVVSNINDEKTIRLAAEFVYQYLFIDGTPTPHILLRDYARGVMEVAYKNKLLAENVSPESFRPPYNSDWPLENPTDKELDLFIGEKSSSPVKSSLMGFLGDFGKYAMGCIHKWSPTPIETGVPETAYELKLKFAEILSDDLKERFVAYLEAQKKLEDEPFDMKKLKFKIRRSDLASGSPEKKPEKTEIDILKDDIELSLNDTQKEEFRWVMGLHRSNSKGAFSRKWAQRWICKRVYDLGWNEELFNDFEKTHAQGYGRSEPTTERIGKKYQWIAFHEFMAHLSDNCCFIDSNYTSEENNQYYGPWQLGKRNIDPTFWLRSTGDTGWDKWEREYWWQPFVYPFYGETLGEINDWLWDESIIPQFETLLQVRDTETALLWNALQSMSSWKKDTDDDESDTPYQDAWYGIKSCVVAKGDVDKLEQQLRNKNLCSFDLIENDSNGSQGFIREYPWHDSYRGIGEWEERDFSSYTDVKIRSLALTAQYEWGAGSSDASLESNINFFLPSKVLVSEMDLQPSLMNFGSWINKDKETVFVDPSAQEEGPSVALVRNDLLLEWLEKNDLQLVWLVGGEKMLFTKWASKFYGRLVYSGIYKLTPEGVSGENWFIEEKPTKVDE